MEGHLTTYCKLLIACGRRAFLDSVFFFFFCFFFAMATDGVDAM